MFCGELHLAMWKNSNPALTIKSLWMVVEFNFEKVYVFYKWFMYGPNFLLLWSIYHENSNGVPKVIDYSTCVSETRPMFIHDGNSCVCRHDGNNVYGFKPSTITLLKPPRWQHAQIWYKCKWSFMTSETSLYRSTQTDNAGTCSNPGQAMQYISHQWTANYTLLWA